MNKIKHYLSEVCDMSLSEHDAKYHPNGFDRERGDTCEFRDRRAALDPVDTDIDENMGIGGIYTGSSASYSRPSLVHIGTGEGAQVYGHGLYGSNQRGVAEHYSHVAKRVNDMRQTNGTKYADVVINGKVMSAKDFHQTAAKYGVAAGALRLDEWGYDYDSAINSLERSRDGKPGAPYMNKDEAQRNIDWLKQTKGAVKLYQGNDRYLYDQTFFTNRKKGDESHLINWYEKISPENINRIRDLAKKEGKTLTNFEDTLKPIIHPKTGESMGAYDKGEDVYMSLSEDFGSPKAATEFLVRADIDGVKYPVDSFGKTKKDGDVAGWNYVSFRDDNIRVNKKYVNGEEVEVKDGCNGKIRRYLKICKSLILTIVFSSVFSVCGCTSVHSQSANDGYVPWWVMDGVPNADGTVITK